MNCVLLQGASDISADMMCSNNMVAVQKLLYKFWFVFHDQCSPGAFYRARRNGGKGIPTHFVRQKGGVAV